MIISGMMGRMMSGKIKEMKSNIARMKYKELDDGWDYEWEDGWNTSRIMRMISR
jgi:hypothetical protein